MEVRVDGKFLIVSSLWDSEGEVEHTENSTL